MSKFIPFHLMPGSWGLKGKTREIAKAEYELSGIDLDYRLAEINFSDDEEKLKLAMLEVDKKHKKISALEYDYAIIELQVFDKIDQDIAKLGADLKHSKITQNEHDKQVATLKNEPWIVITNSGHDSSKGLDGFWQEFDWNDQYIEFLRGHGIRGHDDKSVIQHYLLLLEEETRMEMEASLLEEESNVPNNRITKKVKREDGTTEIQ